MLWVFVYTFEFIRGDQIHNRLCNICIWGLCVMSSHISLLMLLRILVFYRITIIQSEMWFINHCLKVRPWNNILCYMFYSVLTIIVFCIVVLFMYVCHLGLFCDIWFVRHRALPKGSMSCNLPIWPTNHFDHRDVSIWSKEGPLVYIILEGEISALPLYEIYKCKTSVDRHFRRKTHRPESNCAEPISGHYV